VAVVEGFYGSPAAESLENTAAKGTPRSTGPSLASRWSTRVHYLLFRKEPKSRFVSWDTFP